MSSYSNSHNVPQRLIRFGITTQQYQEAREAGLKWCSDCLGFIPEDRFWKGKSNYCSVHMRERQKKYLAALPMDKKRKRWSKYVTPESMERARKYASNRYHSLSPDKKKEVAFRNKLITNFKVMPEWFDRKWKEQNEGCALCGAPHGNIRHAVDHDHNCCPETVTCGNCLRGILCPKCNMNLGMLEQIMENTEWYQSAIAYLKKYSDIRQTEWESRYGHRNPTT